jgi:hypothetical protein
MAGHYYNPTPQEAEIRRVVASGQPGQKVGENPYQPIKAGPSGMHLSSSYTGVQVEGSQLTPAQANR